MADKTKIEWTATVNADGSITPGATWNPITGCTVVSPGCTNCYAMRLAGTRLQHHPSRKGLTTMTKAGPVWNGMVRLNEEWLDIPLRWRKPRKIFVCAHGDLFHPAVPDIWIASVLAVAALAPQHIFQVLTKRADRMQDFFAGMDWGWMVIEQMNAIRPKPNGERYGLHTRGTTLRNVWLGVSAEDQARWTERVPVLAMTPAAVRFVSVEPLIGPIMPHGIGNMDWIIVGGESGPNARGMDPAWARIMRKWCEAHGVPMFMKQMARKAPIPDDLMIRQWPKVVNV